MPNQILQPMLPKPWILNETVNAAGTATALTANTVYLIPVEVTAPCTMTGIRVKVGTATGTSDAGVYDANGNLLGHSGAIANSVGNNTFAVPVALSAGRYILAITPSNSTDTYQINGGINAGLGTGYTATNAATAGVLPNTTGTLVASAQKVQMVGLISGGAP